MLEHVKRWLRRVRLVLRSDEADASMREEMRVHIEMEAEDLMRTRGLAGAEARRQARLTFGGEDRFNELGRDARGTRSWHDLVRDVAHAVRTLRRSAAFTMVSVLTIALGIGAITAMFALVRTILLEPLPYDDSERLVSIRHTAAGLGIDDAGISSGVLFQYRDRAASLESIAVYTEAVVNLSGDDIVSDRVELAMAGPDLFHVLRARPLLGRVFDASDVRYENLDYTAVFPVLLSEELWRRRYGADPDIIGGTIYINARAREVVGVLPETFDFPSPSTQLWLLSSPTEASARFADSFDYDAVARLRAGFSPHAAEADLAAVLAGVEGAFPDATPERIAEVQLRPLVTPLRDAIVGDARTPLWILLAAMVLLLLVACSNVANLFLVRADHRTNEIALRRALGARIRDLVRLFALESGIVAAAGTVLGMLLATWGLRVLVQFGGVDLPRLHELDVDAVVFGVAAMTGLLVALLLTTLSVLHSARATSDQAMRRSAQHGVSTGLASRRLRNVLVTAQVAVALTLLIGSALLVQSFVRVTRVDPGFDASSVLTVDMGLPFSRAQQHRRIYDDLLERVRALPGVTAAAAVSDLPLTSRVWTAALSYPMRVADPAEAGAERTATLKFFMPGYFETVAMPLLEGRMLAAAGDVQRPVYVSATLARRLFPGSSAVGRRIRRLDANGEEILLRAEDGTRVAQPDYVIAGVVGDVRQESLRAAPVEIVYVPVLEPRVDPQFIPTEMSLVIRTSVPPLMLAPAVRDIIRDIDPVLGVARVRTMGDIVDASTARDRFLAVLLVIAAAASLFLGAVGIYGVLSYVVRQRTHEIGIRIALGARARAVALTIAHDTIRVVALGITVGIALALMTTRVLDSVLFGVAPADPVTFLAMTALLITVAFLATLLPTRRAVRIDPVRAMRGE